MHYVKSVLVIFTSFFLFACGNSYVEERLYGTWVEPVNGGIIEFREDGTLSWDGEEGTFEFVRSSNWASCYSQCADGDVRISLPSQTFRKDLRKLSFDQDPNSMYLYGRNAAGLVTDVNIYGLSVNGFTVYRQDSFTGTLMPDHFSRIDAGLPEDSLFEASVNNPGYSGGDLVSYVGYGFRRLEEASQTWVHIGDDYLTGPSSTGALYNSGSNGPLGASPSVSFDAGRTWKDVPRLSVDGFSAWLIGDALTGVKADYDSDIQGYRNVEIWTMDLRADVPNWIKKTDLNGSMVELPYHERGTGAFIYQSSRDNGGEFQISLDGGLTWTEHAALCRHSSQPHSNGYYCQDLENPAQLHWFDFGTMTWTDYDVGFELNWSAVAQVMAPSDAAYLINDEQQLVEWRPSGTQLVTNVSDNITGSFGTVFVLEDQIIVNKSAIWRTER